jgi:methylated-DNA-[protein]-cysteine S-methyltransferase
MKKILNHKIFKTAFGFGAILFRKNPFLVKRIFLPCAKISTLRQRIQNTCPAGTSHTEQRLDLCLDIQAYFAGTPMSPHWKLLDLSGLTPLQKEVLRTVATVPHGETQTYGEISARIGRPQACRFVGTTLSRNPFPVVIPCHRIIRADGSLGGFAGGMDLKKRMLALETNN